MAKNWEYWAPDGNANVPNGNGLPGGTLDAASATTEATADCCSIYWQPASGSTAQVCSVNYKPINESTWRIGFPLFWDDFPRNIATPPIRYLGSLVHLKPGTTYQYRLKLDNGQYTEGTFTTRIDPDDLPIGDTTFLPMTSTDPLSLVPADSGDENGYHLFTFNPVNGSATIDVENNERYCVDLTNVQYVILRGITLIGASRNAVYLRDGCYDIVVDGCDISEFGSVGTAPFGQTRDAAICTSDRDLGINNFDVGRITVQRCQIHDPRFDSNHWDEPNGIGNLTHPAGPQAIYMPQSQGGHIFRYNHIRGSGDTAKKLNDPMGGGWNDSDQGFPGRGTDIYHNIVREGCDDGIEIDGGGDMIRVWGNYIDEVYNAFSVSPAHKGIVYIFRNIIDKTVKEATQADDGSNGGWMVKFQAHIGTATYGYGHVKIFNNTCLQTENKGIRGGVSSLGSNSRVARQGWTRNNIFETTGLFAIDHPDAPNNFENSWDYDLYTNGLDAYTGAETNGISASPVYLNGVPAHTPAVPSGDYELHSTSDGYNDGVFLPGLTLNSITATPDMGAHQHGTALMEFGPTAHISEAPDPGEPPTGEGDATEIVGAFISQPTRNRARMIGS